MDNQAPLQLLQDCEQHIAAGQTEKALKKLVKVPHRQYRRRFVGLSNRYKILVKEQNRGTLSTADFQTGMNKVNVALIATLGEYEGFLSGGEAKGTSDGNFPMLKVVLGAGLAMIAGLLLWKFAGLSKQRTTSICTEHRKLIHVADFQGEGRSPFSETLTGKLRRNVGTFGVEQVGYQATGSASYRDTILQKYFSGCDTSGIFVNGLWDDEVQVFLAYLDMANLQLKVPGLTVAETFILENPPNVVFSIREDARFLADLIIAMVNAYEGRTYGALKRLIALRTDTVLSLDPGLKAFVQLNIGNCYAMRGDSSAAQKSYEEVQSSGDDQLAAIAENNRTIAARVEQIMTTSPKLVRTLEVHKEEHRAIQQALLTNTTPPPQSLESETAEASAIAEVEETIKASEEEQPSEPSPPTDSEVWATVDQNDTSALLAFLDQFPDFENAPAVQEKLAQLRGEHAWNGIKDAPTIQDLRTFLTRFPNHASAAEARTKLEELERQENQEITNKKEEAEPVKPVSGQIGDYKTVTLGGRKWLAQNLNKAVEGSYCYEEKAENCTQYGRLYTWEAAKKACSQLGAGWRLPTDGEWTALADLYGGVYDGSSDGKEAYRALMKGGESGFAALLGGKRHSGGSYHHEGTYGYYWSSTAQDDDHAWVYTSVRGMVSCTATTTLRRTRGRCAASRTSRFPCGAGKWF